MAKPRYTHSIASAESAGEFVTTHWAVGTKRISILLRSYANDVYRVETNSGSFVLKVYRRGWRNRHDAQWEAELCSHLADSGVSVAELVVGRDSAKVQRWTAPEGERAAILTLLLPGSKPKPPWTEALYRDFGRASAHLHVASQSFAPSSPGRLMLADHLIRSPVAKLQHYFGEDRKGYGRFVEVSGRIADDIDALVGSLPRGVCHGDLTLDNIHIDLDGTIGFYDFDLGGHWCFAFDFAGLYLWTQSDPTATRWFDAFRSGYSDVREISASEMIAARLFGTGYLIWDLEHTINNWTIWSGQWRATDEIVEDMLATIFERAEEISY